MILIPMGMLWMAYQLIWYGYAILQQPTPGSCDTCNDGCIGFTDLILPSKVSKVDACISKNWGKIAASGSGQIGVPGTPGFPALPGNSPSAGFNA